MNTIQLRAAVFAGALAVGVLSLPASPALAASPISNAFVANVQANLDFLAQSSRMASERADTNAMKTFAADQLADAERTHVALDEVRPATGKLAAADTDALMTGRSVAIDAPTGGPAKSANGRAPLGDYDISSLSELKGKAFDDALWLKQVDALSQLRADYRAYADDGDDPALSKLAERELPKVEARLAALSKL
ncbi:MAG: DUF4142 domain-containing protein [Caulobacteraceae bacterium]|nr:DUF4142 domain-containing protein [Caulobacter sp.]